MSIELSSILNSSCTTQTLLTFPSGKMCASTQVPFHKAMRDCFKQLLSSTNVKSFFSMSNTGGAQMAFLTKPMPMFGSDPATRAPQKYMYCTTLLLCHSARLPHAFWRALFGSCSSPSPANCTQDTMQPAEIMEATPACASTPVLPSPTGALPPLDDTIDLVEPAQPSPPPPLPPPTQPSPPPQHPMQPTRASASPTIPSPCTPSAKKRRRKHQVRKGNKKYKQLRAGALNYSKDDITALLDCVTEVEPLGANQWAIVATKFSAWAQANSRPLCDHDSLKNKFDKLANAKKKTGDPSCPSPVRKAKHISRDIQNKCVGSTGFRK